MKKSLILVGMLSIGYAQAQSGNVGINNSNPRATLDVKVLDANKTGVSNQGVIIPNLSKSRVATIATPVESTLVYVDDIAYTGNDTKVADITEKGFYYYNGTKWVRTQGPAGARGATGAVGATGPQGPKGDTGAVGPQGPAGARGATGAVGATGPQGPKGDTGAVGPQGPAGARGATGAVGATGPQGPKGDTGAVGPQGPAGARGATGAVGATGPQGPKGDTGAVGPQGPAGARGATGAVGATGPQGPKGDQGGIGLISNGTNTTVSGSGTTVDPYKINATNTTYSGSTSVTLSGTSFQRAALTGDVTAAANNNTLTIANDAVNSAKIADGSVATADLANGAVTAVKLNQMGATNGQVLKWNGSAWAPATDNNTGSAYTAGQAIDITSNKISVKSPVRIVTAAYTLQVADDNGFVYINSSSPVNVTVPSSLPAGFSCVVIQEGVGKVTIAGDGVNMRTAKGTKTRAQNSAIGIIKKSTTEANITGDAE